jgi:alkylation response protein AidB-like acyl-CoA dehydrogenase
VDFAWTEEQLAYKKAVIDFARKELNEGIIERDREGAFSRENWQKCADFGIQGLPFPEEYGGADADIVTSMLMMEGLGYGCRDNGLIFGINAQMWSVQMPIFSY